MHVYVCRIDQSINPVPKCFKTNKHRILEARESRKLFYRKDWSLNCRNLCYPALYIAKENLLDVMSNYWHDITFLRYYIHFPNLLLYLSRLKIYNIVPFSFILRLGAVATAVNEGLGAQPPNSYYRVQAGPFHRDYFTPVIQPSSYCLSNNWKSLFTVGYLYEYEHIQTLEMCKTDEINVSRVHRFVFLVPCYRWVRW